MPQRVGDDLGVHGARPLADLGAGHQDAHAGLGQLQRRLRGQRHLAAAGEAGAVEEQRQADAPARAGPGPRACGAKSRAADRLAQHRPARWRPRPAPARWRSCRPGAGRSSSRSRTGSRPSALGDAVHVGLDGELGLGRAEAAEGAVGGRVGHDHPPLRSARGRSGRARSRAAPRARAPPGSRWCRPRRPAARRSPSPAGGRRACRPVRWRTMAGWRLVVATMSSWRS